MSNYICIFNDVKKWKGYCCVSIYIKEKEDLDTSTRLNSFTSFIDDNDLLLIDTYVEKEMSIEQLNKIKSMIKPGEDGYNQKPFHILLVDENIPELLAISDPFDGLFWEYFFYVVNIKS